MGPLDESREQLEVEAKKQSRRTVFFNASAIRAGYEAEPRKGKSKTGYRTSITWGRSMNLAG
jgi:hypothetical protein